MFFGTFWEHHTCFYNYCALIIKYLNAVLCYSEEITYQDIQRHAQPIMHRLCGATELTERDDKCQGPLAAHYIQPHGLLFL